MKKLLLFVLLTLGAGQILASNKLFFSPKPIQCPAGQTLGATSNCAGVNCEPNTKIVYSYYCYPNSLGPISGGSTPRF